MTLPDRRPIERRYPARWVMRVLAGLAVVAVLAAISLFVLHRRSKTHPATAPKPSVESTT